ncbi:hypothetical protein AZ78_1601 [Lysobacter capsici AZ78]|uniref:Uncharacterized protein n=1 Tax=Lysobacter capsici AZ78 TaxID=1444315 RepID=A0A108U7N9_9GAMM|nr:hypothetical protein [Lysobacter capsici]KWS04052.1 hypothetical protein AZ78_1601 [Lysobacter capsici AZ78]
MADTTSETISKSPNDSEPLSLEQLVDAWYWGEFPFLAHRPHVRFDALDRAFVSQDYVEVLRGLSAMANDDPRVRIRRALTLLLSGSSEIALPLLDEAECLATTAGIGVLAIANYALREGPEGKTHRELARQLIRERVEGDFEYSAFALRQYWHISGWSAGAEVVLKVAQRGLDQPDSEVYLEAYRARALLLLDRIDEVDLTLLARLAEDNAECAATLFELTIENGPSDVAHTAISLVAKYSAAGDDDALLADLLHARVHIQKARQAGDQNQAKEALELVDRHFPTDYVCCAERGQATFPDTEAEAIAFDIRLSAGVILNDTALICDAASWLARLTFTSPWGENDWSEPLYLRFGNAGAGIHLLEADCTRIEAAIGEKHLWSMIQRDRRSAGAVAEGHERPWDVDRLAVLRAAANTLPVGDWCYEQLLEGLLELGKPDPALLGRSVVRTARHQFDYFELPDAVIKLGVTALSACAEAMLSEIDLSPPKSLPPTLVDTKILKRLSDLKRAPLALRLTQAVHANSPSEYSKFSLGYVQYIAKNFAQSAATYADYFTGHPDSFAAARNLALASGLAGEPDRLHTLRAQIAQKSTENGNDWPSLVEEIDGLLPSARRAEVERNRDRLVLAKMDGINEQMDDRDFEPSDLTLGQATAFLALFRSGDIDHVTWQVGPVGGGEVPFDPSGRFTPLLGQLAQAGVLGVASIQQRGIQVGEEGVDFDWAFVTFKTSPSALHLQRVIRDLPREQWPRAWHQELESLAISVAVDECMEYVAHLANQRRLPLPLEADLLAVFRSHLQDMSIGQCWYCIHRSCLQTLDYRTVYPAGQPQLQGHLLNRIRQNGELLVQRGWDTHYDRLRALPRSHFVAALHDVLTGWNDKPRVTRIRDLIV